MIDHFRRHAANRPRFLAAQAQFDEVAGGILPQPVRVQRHTLVNLAERHRFGMGSDHGRVREGMIDPVANLLDLGERLAETGRSTGSRASGPKSRRQPRASTVDPEFKPAASVPCQKACDHVSSRAAE